MSRSEKLCRDGFSLLGGAPAQLGHMVGPQGAELTAQVQAFSRGQKPIISGNNHNSFKIVHIKTK